MRTIKTNLYTFDELSKEAKEKAIKDQQASLNDMIEDWLSDYLKEDLEEMLEKLGIDGNIKDLFYSLSYSQGDGLCFTGNFTWENWQVSITHRGNYYYSSSANIDIYEIDTPLTDDNYNQILERITKIYETICKDLEDNGYSYIEQETSEERAIEYIQDNQFEFYEDGTLY